MDSLDPRRKELIFDYCLGRCSPSQRAEVQDLTDRDKAASQLHTRMEYPLRPLFCARAELCPDRLVEITVQRLCQMARQKGRGAPVEPRVIPIGLRRHWGSAVAVAAVAACVLYAVGILLSPLPSGPLPRPEQVSVQNPGSLPNRIPFDSPGWARFNPVDGNQNPEPSPGIPWPGELNPYPAHPLFQQGPPMLPASLRDGLELGPADRFLSPAPVGTPDQQR